MISLSECMKTGTLGTLPAANVTVSTQAQVPRLGSCLLMSCNIANVALVSSAATAPTSGSRQLSGKLAHKARKASPWPLLAQSRLTLAAA